MAEAIKIIKISLEKFKELKETGQTIIGGVTYYWDSKAVYVNPDTYSKLEEGQEEISDITGAMVIMQTEINQNSAKIETKASAVVVNDLSDDLHKNYSTTTKMNSAITQTANKITTDVSKTYETKTDAGITKQSLQSQISQQAGEIAAKISETGGSATEGFGWSLTKDGFSLKSTIESGGTKTYLPVFTVDKKGTTTIAGNVYVDGYVLDKDAISTVEVQYALSTSSSAAPTEGWSTTAPTWEAGKYMWQRTYTIYADGKRVISAETCIQGAKGEKGDTGTGVSIKGNVANYAALLAIENPQQGDSYVVEQIEEGAECGHAGERNVLFTYSASTSSWTYCGEMKGVDASQCYLKLSTRFHTGTRQAEEITIQALKKTGNREEVVDTDATIKYKFESAEEWTEYTAPITTCIDEDLLIKAYHTTTEYASETITFSPLNKPVLDLDRDSAYISYNSLGKVDATATAVSNAAVGYNGDEVTEGVTYSWALTGCTQKSGTTLNTKTIEIDKIDDGVLSATAKCTATYKGISMEKTFSIAKNYINSMYSISIANDSDFIPCEIDGTPIYTSQQWVDETTHVVTVWYGDEQKDFMIYKDTLPSTSSGPAIVYHTTNVTKESSSDPTDPQSSYTTWLVGMDKSASIGEISYSLYNGQNLAAVKYFKTVKQASKGVDYKVSSSASEIHVNAADVRTPSTLTFTVKKFIGGVEDSSYKGNYIVYVDEVEKVRVKSTDADYKSSYTLNSTVISGMTSNARLCLYSDTAFENQLESEEVGIKKDGESSVAYSILTDPKAHVGTYETRDITITAKKKLGFTGLISTDTDATIWYKSYKSGENWVALTTKAGVATLSHEIIANKEIIGDRDICIKSTHGSTDLDEEVIEYNAPDTPRLSLDNNNASISYTADGSKKITEGDYVESTATLSLNGKDIESGVTYTWDLQNCSGTSNKNYAKVENLSATKAAAVCTAKITDENSIYKDKEYKAVFNIIKLLQGNKGEKGDKGDPAYSLTVDNDFDSVPCDSAGKPKADYDWQGQTTHRVKAYYGTEDIVIEELVTTEPTSATDEKYRIYYNITDLKDIKKGKQAGTPTLSTDKKTVAAWIWDFEDGANKGTITYALYKGKVELCAVKFEASKLLAGQNGDAAVDYWITSSDTAVKKSKDGTKLPSSLTFSFFRQEGNKAATAYNGYYTYLLDDDATVYGKSSVEAFSIETSKFNKKIVVTLWQDNTQTVKYDSETVSVLEDGQESLAAASIFTLTADPTTTKYTSANKNNFNREPQIGEKVVINAKWSHDSIEDSYNISATIDSVSSDVYKLTWNATDIVKTTGSTGPHGWNTATLQLFKRAASASIDWTNDITYTFADKSWTEPSGWSKTIPAQTTENKNPVWCTAATACSDKETDTIASNEWPTPVKLADNGRDGIDGDDAINTASIFLYKRSNTGTPSPNKWETTYTFKDETTKKPKLEPTDEGKTTYFDGWTLNAIPEGTDPCYIIQATAVNTNSTDTIATTDWSSVALYTKPTLTYLELKMHDDLNNMITKDYCYYTGSTAVCESLKNTPEGFPKGELRLVIEWCGLDNYFIQHLYCKDSTTNKEYTRNYSGDTFKDWEEKGVSAPKITSVTTYYAHSENQPAKPTTNPPSSDWSISLPTYDESKKNYWESTLTVFDNSAFSWSDVGKNSSFAVAQGKSTTYYSDTEPENPKKGDAWFCTDKNPTSLVVGTEYCLYIPKGTNMRSICRWGETEGIKLSASEITNINTTIQKSTRSSGPARKIIGWCAGSDEWYGVQLSATEGYNMVPASADFSCKFKFTSSDASAYTNLLPYIYRYGKTNTLYQYTGSSWNPISDEMIANKVTATYVNALDITAKKIEVKEGDHVVFNADTSKAEVSIGGFGVDNNSISINVDSSGDELVLSDNSVLISTGTSCKTRIGTSENIAGWSIIAGKNFGVNSNGIMYAAAGQIGGGEDSEGKTINGFTISSAGLTSGIDSEKVTIGPGVISIGSDISITPHNTIIRNATEINTSSLVLASEIEASKSSSKLGATLTTTADTFPATQTVSASCSVTSRVISQKTTWIANVDVNKALYSQKSFTVFQKFWVAVDDGTGAKTLEERTYSQRVSIKEKETSGSAEFFFPTIQGEDISRKFGSPWVTPDIFTDSKAGVFHVNIDSAFCPTKTDSISLGNKDYRWLDVYTYNLGSTDKKVNKAYINNLGDSDNPISSAYISSFDTTAPLLNGSPIISFAKYNNWNSGDYNAQDDWMNGSKKLAPPIGSTCIVMAWISGDEGNHYFYLPQTGKYRTIAYWRSNHDSNTNGVCAGITREEVYAENGNFKIYKPGTSGFATVGFIIYTRIS